MARQISDLPVMNANEARDDDILLIRDVSSQIDKKITLAALLAGAKINPEDLLEMIYPVGSTIDTTDSNFNPEAVFGGDWTLELDNKPKRQFVASQELFNGVITRNSAGTTNLIGAYSENLIEGIWENITIPSGWHKEYKISCQISTSSSDRGQMALNNIKTSEVGTYSADTFRKIGTSNFFKYSDIVLETTPGYNNPGINCKVIQIGSGESKFWQGTIQGFLTSDENYYVWRRIA